RDGAGCASASLVTSSVIVLVINGVNILTLELKGDPPVAAHRYGPGAFAVAAELMKLQPRKRHVSRRSRGSQPAKNQMQPFSVLRLDAGLGASREERR